MPEYDIWKDEEFCKGYEEWLEQIRTREVRNAKSLHFPNQSRSKGKRPESGQRKAL